MLSFIQGIGNFINGIGNGIKNTFENMFTTTRTPEENQKYNEEINEYAEGKIGPKTEIGKQIDDTLSRIDNFLPNIIGSIGMDLTTGGKTNLTEKTLDNTPIVNGIKDKVESVINNTPSDQQNEEFKDDTNQMLIDFMKGQEETRQKELQKAYAREDAIRKETQEREDTAYQRAVEDMRKAGINPNLVGISPSASGGGITSASRTEQVLGNEITAYTTILNSLINKDTTMSEGDKDRITNLISSASQMLVMLKMFGGK